MQAIKNTSDSVHHLPGKYGGKPPSGKKNRPSQSVVIIPDQIVNYDLEGLIEDRPKLAHLRQHFAIVSGGAVAVAAAVPSPAPVEMPAPMSAGRGTPAWAVGRTDAYVPITTAEAAELIAAETDIDELKAWRAVETRKGVQGLLDERMKAL